MKRAEILEAARQLITVFPLPQKYRKTASKIKKGTKP